MLDYVCDAAASQQEGGETCGIMYKDSWHDRPQAFCLKPNKGSNRFTAFSMILKLSGMTVPMIVHVMREFGLTTTATPDHVHTTPASWFGPSTGTPCNRVKVLGCCGGEMFRRPSSCPFCVYPKLIRTNSCALLSCLCAESLLQSFFFLPNIPIHPN